jgi:hypothetical protein
MLDEIALCNLIVAKYTSATWLLQLAVSMWRLCLCVLFILGISELGSNLSMSPIIKDSDGSAYLLPGGNYEIS